MVPNLTLLSVIAWSFHRGPNEGIIWGLVGGLASDLASGVTLGISPIPLMIAALAAGVGYRRVVRDNLVLPIGITLVAVVLYQTSYLILFTLTSRPIQLPVGIWQIGAPLTVIHMTLMPLFYFGIAWLARLLEGPRLQIG